MTSDALAVLQEALGLDENDRATVAAELLASLPAPDTEESIGSQAWVREVETRAREVLANDVEMEDWTTVEERILNSLSAE